MYQALPNRLHIKDSDVAGQGIFAREDVPEGLILGMSHIVVDEVIYRTPLGGFINHSDNPNCVKWKDYDGGDHQILVGEVKSYNYIEDEPLLYWNGKIT